LTIGKYLQTHCAICGVLLEDPQFASNYPNLVCEACQWRAVNARGRAPRHNSMAESGDNPVYIDGIKCWRRYRFGGYITMRDDDDCTDVFAFYELHGWG
jgi:hypothetical protein